MKKTGDGVDRAKGGEGLIVGKHAREFAAEVGLDVYSDNPYVQDYSIRYRWKYP